MFSFFRKKQNLHRSDDRPNADVILIDVISVPRIDRWRVYHRLQELKIPCWCLPDGSLRVEVQTGVGALLLRSVVQQFIAPRQEMVNWLERCWETDLS
jgi:hypothetical protein